MVVRSALIYVWRMFEDHFLGSNWDWVVALVICSEYPTTTMLDKKCCRRLYLGLYIQMDSEWTYI